MGVASRRAGRENLGEKRLCEVVVGGIQESEGLSLNDRFSLDVFKGLNWDQGVEVEQLQVLA